MKSLLLSCVSIAALALAGQAQAQNQAAPAGNDAQATADGSVDAVIVTGYSASLKSALAVKKDNVGVVDAIASEDVGKFPSTNIAEALQRIPGVAIDRNGGQGRFVTIRGLGPAFNAVYMNGRQVTSEGGIRAFSFDVLPAEMISGSQVYKSGTAYVAAGGIGGTINLNTLRPLDMGNTIVGSAKGVYDKRRDKAQPQLFGLISHKFLDNKLGILGGVSYQKRSFQISSTDLLWGRFTPRPTTQGGSLSPLAVVVNPGNVTANAYYGQEYRENVDLLDETRTTFQGAVQFEPIDGLRFTVDGFHSDYEQDGLRGSLNAFQNIDRLDRIELDAQGIDRKHSQNLSGRGAFETINSHINRHPKTDLIGLNANWRVTPTLRMIGDVAWSRTNLPLSPYGANIIMGFRGADSLDQTTEVPILTRGVTQAELLDPVRQNLHIVGAPGAGTKVHDTIRDAKLDFNWQPDVTGSPIIRFGGMSRKASKEAVQIGQNPNTSSMLLGLLIPGVASVPGGAAKFSVFPAKMPTSGAQILFIDNQSAVDYTSSPAALTARDVALNLAPGTSARAFAANGGFSLRTLPGGFVVEEKVDAAYASLSFEGDLGGREYQIELGGRLERTTTHAEGYQLQLLQLEKGADPTTYIPTYASATPTLTSKDNKYTNFLPNVNTRFTLMEEAFLPGDALWLRLNWTTTMARPELTDISPRLTLAQPRPNFLTGASGNINLKPYVSENYDAGLEYYFGDANFVGLSGFYKDITDFIVQQNVPTCFTITNPTNIADANVTGNQACYTLTTPVNGRAAKLKGLELSGQLKFDFLPGLLSGFGASANLTFVKSNAELDPTVLTSVFAIPGLSNTRNFTVFYEKGMIEARLAYSRRSKFYEAPAGNGNEPRFVLPYEQFDGQISLNMNEWLGRDVQLVVEGTNLFGEDLRKSGRFEPMFARLEDTGPRYSVELRFRY
jgi:iron complex outermembrane receptor protein